MPHLPRKTEPPRGVLYGADRSRSSGAKVELNRFMPSPALADFVEHFWIVRWDVRESGPQTAETLPHPSIHWVNEGSKGEIGGIERGKFTRTLEGEGRVVSVKFRPGGFCAFVEDSMQRFTGRRFAAEELLGERVRGLAAELTSLDDAAAATRFAEALEALEPRPDPLARRAGEIVEEIARDHAITSVVQVCERFRTTPLALQRLFRRKIGVSPKWVIQRYRLHEAIERIHADWKAGHGTVERSVASFAELALELGFTDQAHFAKTFKAFIGVSPGQYARRLAR